MPILDAHGNVADIPLNHTGILNEIIEGLSKPVKTLPPKLFYDERGSQLFDQITQLEEYYLTRTETAIMRRYVGEMAASFGPGCLLIEYGSGSSIKTRILLDHLQDLAGYVSIDISRQHLYETADALRAAYPDLPITPVWADYTRPFDLNLLPDGSAKRVAYFPGSTIGNFYPEESVVFLRRIRVMVGGNGGLLIGADLQKSPEILNLAYNDPAGITAAFNLNMLAHINREYGGDFDLEQFQHRAFYNEGEGRIEMHLVSREDQTTHVNGNEFSFHKGESILSEVSYKYTLEGFSALAQQGGFAVEKVWVDQRGYFSVHCLRAA